MFLELKKVRWLPAMRVHVAAAVWGDTTAVASGVVVGYHTTLSTRTISIAQAFSPRQLCITMQQQQQQQQCGTLTAVSCRRSLMQFLRSNRLVYDKVRWSLPVLSVCLVVCLVYLSVSVSLSCLSFVGVFVFIKNFT